jgi:Glycosyl hydrolase family 63 C-terminal domain
MGILSADDPAILTASENINNLHLLKQLYPLFKKNYMWFLETQQGETPSSHPGHYRVFRWRGRRGPHILTSGTESPKHVAII